MTLSTRIAAGLTGALACLAVAAPSQAADYQQVAEQHAFKIERQCINQIKAGLNDPDSFQYDRMTVFPSMHDGAVTMINAQFRAKNGFGGVVRERAVCHVDANGNLVRFKFL